jgi:Eukaryotic initiation factor 4E
LLSNYPEVDGRSIEAFSIFKKGIRPEWEDAANRSGSELTCRKTFQPDKLDLYWENLVLALIGETIDDGDEICGCRVVDKSSVKGKGPNRTMYKIELWLRSGNAEVADKLRLRMIEAITDGETSKGGGKNPLDFEFKRRAP